MFLVLKKDGQQRPVLNLKKLNVFVWKDIHKYKGISTCNHTCTCTIEHEYTHVSAAFRKIAKGPKRYLLKYM